jgi:hypothetical protein
MNTLVADSLPPEAVPAHPAGAGPETRSEKSLWLSPSAWASFGAGALTPFTVSLVGEMPVGEFILTAAAGWAVLCIALHQAWPGELIRHRFLRVLLAAQTLALGAYIFSDLYRHSFPLDMARGWSRMVFLAVDIVGIAYLFGCDRRNWVVFVVGQCAGETAAVCILGPMFGDLWKFGLASPATYLTILVAPLAGPWVAVAATAAIGVVNFALDYRSLGGVCLLAAMLALLQTAPRRLRLRLAPLAAAAAAAAILTVYQDTQSGGDRTTRSDVERSAMITAAAEAFQESPWIGHGSWFSNSRVYDHFMEIRYAKAREARVGGFADANNDPGAVALHSQILVTLAEGGLFGGAFFFVFGAGLLISLHQAVLVEAWHRLAPICTLLLLVALWNLCFSPFSGAHRVYIAAACGLMLMMRLRSENPAHMHPAFRAP